jgi:hypothetical protein
VRERIVVCRRSVEGNIFLKAKFKSVC